MFPSTIPLIHSVITEDARKKKEGVSIEDAALLVSQECKQALHAAPLWYNSSSRVEALASHPKPKHTGSVLVNLIDNVLPNWKECPPYSSSFSLTSKPIYNIAHRAFPIDGAKLVLAPSMYFGSCFNIAFERLNLNGINFFESVFETLHKVFNEWSKRKEGKGIGASLSSSQIEQFLIKAQELLDTWPNHDLMFDRAAENVNDPEDVKGKAKAVLMIILKHGGGELLTGLNRIFDPAMNGFRLISINEYNEPHNGEIWTDAPCVMVRNDVLGEL